MSALKCCGFVLAGLQLVFSAAVFAQTTENVRSTPSTSNNSEATIADKFSYDLSLRARYELVDWFEPAAPGTDNDYAFAHTKLQFGTAFKHEGLKLYAQGQYVQHYDLPSAANGPGSVYQATNGDEHAPGDIILRQAYAEYSSADKVGLGRVGRFLFSNGGEAPATNKDVEAIKSQRIYNRVIGPFDFTNGRSFDGVFLRLGQSSAGTIATSLMHPTFGGFSTKGSSELSDVSLVTASYTTAEEYWPGTGEGQLFYYYYGDSRDKNVVKADNRLLDVRKLDTESLDIHNFGAHWVQLYDLGDAVIDSLVWGILQTGDWGTQSHQAEALALETGLRLKDVSLKPAFRLGYNWGSGDSDPNDGNHHTFFQMLPTARQYAMTPFFNEMNTQDLFVQAAVNPIDPLKLSSFVHYLWLSDSKDLLYSGGGANKSRDQFGYTGTALGGDAIGLLWDVTLSYEFCKNLSGSVYYGHLFGASGANKVFNSGGDLDYGFLELTAKL